MSWDGYIDNLIAHSKDGSDVVHCDKACIIGLDGGAHWTSQNLPNSLALAADEAVTIARCFKTKDFSQFETSGIHVGGQKYQYLRQEDGKLVLGKKKDLGSLTIQASKTGIVIAHTIEGYQHGTVNKAVTFIAEYLESVDM